MKSIILFSPLLMYIWIILNWVLMFQNFGSQDFLDLAEERAGAEVIFLIAGFLLVGTASGKQTTREKRVFWGIFILFLLIGLFITKDNWYGLISVFGIFANHLVEYFSQTGDYGDEAGDNFMKGKGGIFKFVLLVLYGLPVGFLLSALDSGNNALAICASIIGYYLILFFIELNNSLNRN
ncbi:hypothetical protein [Epilithonimonas zeae]|uniref:hypothetical protein n=1 Tax=Epilithonimonas zeae TaxID=1416779 RepID=UPI00200D29B0|nr:hypothetical protein [Epilithonimonas zeae]UQB68874.1 hypothetical protein KI430_00045 [Epilithonimonas zeae]